MRIASLILLATVLGAAENILPDNLYGSWVVDEGAVTKEQKADAEAAALVEGFGITFTLRTARTIFVKDEMLSGMWRLEESTPTSATLIIQPKGGEERRYHLTLSKQRLTIAESPGALPLKKAR